MSNRLVRPTLVLTSEQHRTLRTSRTLTIRNDNPPNTEIDVLSELGTDPAITLSNVEIQLQ